MIQDLNIKIEENLNCFSAKIKKEIITLNKDIEQELSSFNIHGINDQSRKESGRKILSKLSMLNSKLKANLDKKVEVGR